MDFARKKMDFLLVRKATTARIAAKAAPSFASQEAAWKAALVYLATKICTWTTTEYAKIVLFSAAPLARKKAATAALAVALVGIVETPAAFTA